MGVKCEEYSQVCVMDVDGDFTAENAKPPARRLEDRIEQRRVVDFVVDFERAGLSTARAWRRSCG